MKRSLITLFSLLFALELLFGQEEYMRIRTKDGNTIEIRVNDIENIDFYEAESGGYVYVPVDGFSIVGTWQNKTEYDDSKEGNYTRITMFKFSADGSYTLTSWREGESNKNTATGLYSYNAGLLVLNEWSDREGYEAFEVLVREISTTKMAFYDEDYEDVYFDKM